VLLVLSVEYSGTGMSQTLQG